MLLRGRLRPRWAQTGAIGTLLWNTCSVQVVMTTTVTSTKDGDRWTVGNMRIHRHQGFYHYQSPNLNDNLIRRHVTVDLRVKYSCTAHRIDNPFRVTVGYDRSKHSCRYGYRQSLTAPYTVLTLPTTQHLSPLHKNQQRSIQLVTSPGGGDDFRQNVPAKLCVMTLFAPSDKGDKGCV